MNVCQDTTKLRPLLGSLLPLISRPQDIYMGSSPFLKSVYARTPPPQPPQWQYQICHSKHESGLVTAPLVAASKAAAFSLKKSVSTTLPVLLRRHQRGWWVGGCARMADLNSTHLSGRLGIRAPRNPPIMMHVGDGSLCKHVSLQALGNKAAAAED
ncbi:hypothetical protein LX32DRAFT_242383 [Colletotrichum zoysiae]|uniref:Uncharacterized protein n=1 Tax=Colletotrichum zoysiae TaxID=1216348 RepID=A0AAD9LUF5_9PEZI|nr:hypothetical protein LX32DRAFT_242383 [Colletotrichum zoysiae]